MEDGGGEGEEGGRRGRGKKGRRRRREGRSNFTVCERVLMQLTLPPAES